MTGYSVITLNILQETDCVIIHSKSMNISNSTMRQYNKRIGVQDDFTYEENDFYVLKLSTPLSVGVASLEIGYYYELGDDLVGFYRSSYTDASGNTHWIATTQFEPTDARKAFPCFDEPALKATFTITITHSSSLNAHSNMPVLSNVSDGAVTTTRFNTSVKMSSYLVAFVVSEFECMSKKTDTQNRVVVS